MLPVSRTVVTVTIAVTLGVLAGYQWGRFATTQKERKVQENLAGRLKLNEQKLKQNLLATKNAMLKLAPQRPFAKNLARYSEDERAAIQRHAEAAISALPSGANRFDRVAAVTAYVHQFLEPKLFEDGRASDVLERRGSNCGGFAICAGELLATLGIESDFVFLRGGSFGGHTMLQAFLDGQNGALVDPYFGVIYLDSRTGAPLSVNNVVHGEHVLPQHAIHKYQQDASLVHPCKQLADAFSSDAPPSSPAYQFPELFEKADGVYEANSGVRDFIQVPLQPGVTLGVVSWKPSDDEPVPWTSLQNWKQSSGQWLSWAFTLGDMPMGNRVAHTYSLSHLVPGQHYRLALHVTSAGKVRSSSLSAPVVSIQQVAPWGRSFTMQFEERRYEPHESFVSQRMEVDFDAVASEMSFVGVATGYFLLNGITLESLQSPAALQP